MQRLELLSASEIGELVNGGLIKPSEVLAYFMERIIKRNDRLNAFVYTKFDEAMELALKEDERLLKGEKLGPFAGVPFALKDFLPNKVGWESSHGGVKCLKSIDTTQSVFCKAMEDLGGIAVGKCNAPSYGFRGTTDNPLYGPTKNPFNLAYNAGGSSGGSAAAVSDGLVLIAEGGDAGGSIRIPASYTNLFGFKAGIGTIPSVNRPDAFSASHPYCFNGGLTKTVLDCAILLNKMAYYDSLDPNSRPQTVDYVKALTKSVKGRKIAYTVDFNLFPVKDEVKRKFLEEVQSFKQLGIKVEPVTFNFKHSAYEMAEIWCKAITVDCAIELNLEANKGHDLLKEHEADFPKEFIHYKKVCDQMGIMDLYAFNLVRTEVLDEFERILKDYDYIASPVTIVDGILNTFDKNTKGPVEVNGVKVEPLIGFTETFLANFSGHPAASLPSGFFCNNVPFGMQVIGRKFKDHDLLTLCAHYEKIKPWRLKYPTD